MPDHGSGPNKSMQFDPSLLRNRLFRAIDENYNVTNSVIVAEVLGQLERFRLSRAALAATRLDWYIQQLRWREDDRSLVARARLLLRQWRPQDHTSKPPASSSRPEKEIFRPPSSPRSSLAPAPTCPRKRSDWLAREVEERRKVWREREEMAEREERDRKRRRQARWLSEVNYRWQTLISQL